MKLKYNGLFLATLAAMQLSGCGGGGSNDTPNSIERPDPTPIVFSPISIKALEQNKCGNLPVIADVVFHQANGTFISSEKTQADGQFESNIPTNAQHVSFVYRSETDTGKKYLQIQSVLNIQNGFDVDAVVFANYDQCGCSTIDYDLETLRAESPDSYLHGASIDPILLREAPDKVSLCTDEQQQLLFTRFEGVSSGGLFDTSAPATVALSDTQFTAQGTELNFGEHTFEPKELITLSSYVGNTNVYNEHVNEARYNHTSYKDNNGLLIFKDLNTVNYLSTTRLQESTAFGVSVSTNSYAINKVNDEGQVTGAKHITNNAELVRGYQILAESLADESASDVAVINFSSADERIDAVTFTLNWEDAHQGTSRWHFITDGNDAIPDLSFGDIIPEDKVTPLEISMNVSLLALNSDLSFNDLREVMIEGQESFEKRVESKLYDGAAIFSIIAKPL
ncbi:hypothetical protein [Pseudoalteromonas luteoviolacea]|uniref:Lipoprotein n=1 Tax=Pseudoalteromonas luteoviolacea DSM 6061 TaxID=1365250 RepID=A0A166UA35_9GAMM|nr:hypothetical protein [Pseudoalteromonas luteoviolacea]KZN29719.1 hypothetical protein N475_05320 [Pseudoalteromonas luteoviolacea DSM 6061]MBE0389386.1 hypothetical protein [Pseudoalteromonas luteoviolacea DSM 6061]TQF67931.1 hypothetical protein FLM44_22400 [Pseudoalteromonas luteoviolacea]